ncbi:MAG: hypothetical protein AAFX05_03100, partial [Planctomycetota bacterium]
MKIAVTAAALVSIAGTASAIQPSTLAYTDNRVEASEFSRELGAQVYNTGFNDRGAVIGDTYDALGFWQDATYAFQMIFVDDGSGNNIANRTYTFDGIAEVNPDATQLGNSVGFFETQFNIGTANNLPLDVVQASIFSADGADLLPSVGTIINTPLTDLRVDFGNFGISGIDIAFPPGATSFSVVSAILFWINTGLATGT